MWKTFHRWLKHLQGPIAALAGASSKGLSLVSHEAYLDTYLEHREAMWQELSKRKWGDQRLRLYGGKRRCVDRFFNRVEKADTSGREVVVAYGAGTFPPTGRGERSVPTKWALAKCKLRWRHTYTEDEFRSTMVHWKDGTVLRKVMDARTGKQVRGLLWYENPTIPGQSNFVNRDQNGAINIRKCFMAGPEARPEIMRRGGPALSQKVAWVVSSASPCVAVAA